MDAPAIDVPVTPVTVECVKHASEISGVPLVALKGILQAEGGTPGKASRNRNGTRDVGPMQINTIWTKHFAEKGVSMELLKNNGCANVLAGTWILKSHYDRTRNIWRAVARYHSKTGKYQYRYLRRVYDHLSKNTPLERVIYRINMGIDKTTENTDVRSHGQERKTEERAAASSPLVAASAESLGRPEKAEGGTASE